MNSDLSQYRANPLVTEVRRLLAAHPWHVPRGGYARGAAVQILLYPGATTHAGMFDVPLTVRPLHGAAEQLEGLSLALWRHDADATMWYGRLNRRGQALFRHMPTGIYQIRVLYTDQTDEPTRTPKLPEDLPATITHLLSPPISLPRAVIPLGAHTERQGEQMYQHASGALIVTVSDQDADKVEVSVEAYDRAWDGTLVGIGWSQAGASTFDEPDSRLLLLPLAWSNAFNACIAHLMLECSAAEVVLHLPEQAWPVHLVTGSLIAALRESVVRTTRTHTRRAWERLFQQNAALPPDARAVLATVLGTTDDG